MSGKVLPVTPLLSGVLCIESSERILLRLRGWGNAWISLVHTGEHLIIKPAMASKVIVTRVVFQCMFKQNIPLWSSRMER